MELHAVGLGAASYAMGGVPSGYLIARYTRGIDIREHGSGNPGAANVYRVVGRWAGWGTLALDALKGFVPVTLARRLYPNDDRLLIGCGALAIIGHVWTIFLGLRGGKGVATSCGVFAALLPLPTFITFLAFVAAVAASGHISVGSILAAVVLPVVSFGLDQNRAFSIFAAAVSVLVLYKHIPNMRRLMGRGEPGFGGGTGRSGGPGGRSREHAREN